MTPAQYRRQLYTLLRLGLTPEDLSGLMLIVKSRTTRMTYYCEIIAIYDMPRNYNTPRNDGTVSFPGDCYDVRLRDLNITLLTDMYICKPYCKNKLHMPVDNVYLVRVLDNARI